MTALWIALGVVAYLACGMAMIRLCYHCDRMTVMIASAGIWLWPLVLVIDATAYLARWAGAEIEDE